MNVTELMLALPIMVLGRLLRRDRNSWSIIVDKRQGFEGNLLAIAAHLAKRKGTTVYVIDCGNRGIGVDEALGENVKFIRHHSFAELKARLRSRQVVVTHSLKPALGRYSLLNAVRIINVWHGIPVKGMGNMDQSFPRNRLAVEFKRRKAISIFCVSSELERTFIAACHLMDASRIHVLGIPRTDMLIDQSVMTSGQCRIHSAISAVKSGRKMVLYAPTFREEAADSLGLTRADMERLNVLFADHDVLFAVRPHPKEAAAYDQLVAGLSHIVHADSRRWPDTNTVLLQSDALVTDYSSIWLEYLLLNRPLAAFWWDFQKYADHRGFLIDLEAIFPGPKAFTVPELEQCFRRWLSHGFANEPEWGLLQQQMRHLFHKHVDGRSSERVVNAATLD